MRPGRSGPAVEQAEALRREGGHLADGLLEAQHRLLAHVALEHARVLPVAARPVERRVVLLVRRRHDQPVGRDHRERALQQRPDVLLLDVVEEADEVVVLLDDEVEEGVEAVGAALGGDVGDGAAAQLRVAAGVEHDHPVEAAVAHDAGVPGARQRVLEHLAPERGARLGVREQRDQRVVIEVEDGLRQRPREPRREVGVDVVVGGRVQAAAAGLLDQGEVGRGVVGRAPLGRVVRDLHGAAGGAPELERLGDGGEDGLALAAHVARVDALVAGHDLAQAAAAPRCSRSSPAGRRARSTCRGRRRAWRRRAAAPCAPARAA